MVEYDAGLVVGDTLGNGDVGQKALLALAVEVDEAAHGVEQAAGDGQAQAQPPRQAAASGVRLVKNVVHLRQLGVGHADAGVPDVHDQIDAVLLPAEPDTHINAALLGEFNRVLHQDFQHVGNFL